MWNAQSSSNLIHWVIEVIDYWSYWLLKLLISLIYDNAYANSPKFTKKIMVYLGTLCNYLTSHACDYDGISSTITWSNCIQHQIKRKTSCVKYILKYNTQILLLKCSQTGAIP